ncbi:MAG: WYL domain-containing protein [Candidatus Coproplasma sp.]
MAYNELIKNFEKIRAYMREFYVYGFKSRDQFDKKSLRSYDDERRRLESWLGEHMSFVRTLEGKNVFISIDSRNSNHNPLYNAFKAKSFTDCDITLHFIIFDVLYNEDNAYSLPQLMVKINEEYLSRFEEPMIFDESTLRKKLKEYIEEGIIVSEKQGKRLVYRRAKYLDLGGLHDVIDFYSEIAPCGVIGSFLHDKEDGHDEAFSFKHHYITSAIDSDVLCSLFLAMRSKSVITVNNLGRKAAEPRKNRVVPLRIRISVQDGKQYLMAYQPDFNCIKSFRIDYLSNVKIEEPTPRFDELREILDDMESKTWGVTCRGSLSREERLEHVEFTVKIENGEEYIVKRLQREKRIGRVEKVDDFTYRFTADVYDTSELIPWIRTFISRIEKMNFSNRKIENMFKQDVKEMYRIYGIEDGGETDGIQ